VTASTFPLQRGLRLWIGPLLCARLSGCARLARARVHGQSDAACSGPEAQLQILYCTVNFLEIIFLENKKPN
jgi:hypothetical protein